ncbi:16676_t:CDS:2, partial [Gigaspora margarita]
MELDEELPKPLAFHKKENYIANLTLMEIDPNKVSSEINMKINPMQEDEIAVSRKQTIKPIKNLFVGLKGKAKIEIKSDETHPKAASLQKVPQINVLLQEILKRLEIVENNQSVLLVTDKKSVKIFKEFDPSEAIEQLVLDKVWDSFMNSIIFATNKNILKKKIRNTPNSKRSEMKEKKSFLHRSIVEISKIIRKINKHKTKVPEQVKLTKWNNILTNKHELINDLQEVLNKTKKHFQKQFSYSSLLKRVVLTSRSGQSSLNQSIRLKKN